MSLDLIHVADVVQEELGMRLSTGTGYCLIKYGFHMMQINARIESQRCP